MAETIKTPQFTIKSLVMLLLLLPVPLIFSLIHINLKSTGGWLIMIIFQLIPLFGLAGFYWKKHTVLFKRAGIITMIILAVILVGEILFLPYQAYELWFNLFRSGIERGRVSHIFVKLGSWLTALTCWVAIQRPSLKETLFNSLYLPLFFVFLLWPTLLTALIFFLAFLMNRVNKHNVTSITMILALIMVIGLTGIKTKAKGARFIDKSSDTLITLMTDIWPSLPILYDVPLYGESLSKSIEEGGRPTLTSHIIMTVTGQPGDQIYLRNKIYASPGERNQAINLSELSQAAIPPLNGRKIPIRIRTDYINMIPFTEDTIILDMGEKQYALDSKEKTLLPEPALFMNDTYVLIEERNREYRLVEDEDQLNPYLNPSLDVTEEMELLAAELKGDNPIETVRNIRTYLTANYTYTLNTEEDKNYTERFLFTSKEGYCLHFASSFVVLARLNGIPARFVEGYLVNFPSEKDYMENYGGMPTEITTGVSGLSSHIWPEIYLSDRGWVSFEVTAPFVRGDSLTSEDRLTRRQLSEIQGFIVEEENLDYIWQQIPSFVYPLLALFIVIILLYSPVKTFLKKKTNHSSHIVNRYVRLAHHCGISLPRERGWLIWEKEITLNISDTAELMSRVMPLILRLRYTNKDLNHSEKETLKKDFEIFKSACKAVRRR